MRRVTLGLAFALIACAPASDTPAPAAAAGENAVADVRSDSSTWPDDLGAFVAIERAGAGDALLFRRDTASMPAGIMVLGFDSLATPVTMRDVRGQPCAARALLRVDGAPAGWSLALDRVAARPLLIDAVEDLAHADSQRVVIRIQRALNTLPDTGAAMEFHALPVVVRDAWVVHAPSGPLLVARGARLRNVEAAAHEELRFVVLDGDRVQFVARTAGEEDAVESWDLLAALASPRGLMLAVAREGVRSLQLELVRRDSVAWRSVWRSDAISCPSAH
jgi:hypothetical protein